MLERLFLRLGIAVVVLTPLLLGVKWERASRPDKEFQQRAFIMAYSVGHDPDERAKLYDNMIRIYTKGREQCVFKQN